MSSRFSPPVSRAVIGLTITLAMSARAQGTTLTYDAVADFSTVSNPNGAWSYGDTATLGGSFSPLLPGSCNSLAGWDLSGGAKSVGAPPFIYAGSGSCGTGTPGPTFLDLHPGPVGQYVDVRWTSPSAGTYAVKGIFEGIDPHPTTTDVHVLLNHVSQFDSSITSFGVPVSFVLSGSVLAGDTLEFVVGFGSDGDYFFDSTGFDALISLTPVTAAPVPEPATVTLTALGLVGALTRGRRRRAPR